MPTFNPLDFPLCLDEPRRVTAIAWHEHIPFAFSLVQMQRPRSFVELGVHHGDSYLAVCQAVAALKLDCACSGIDTWEGDQHAGFYPKSILDELRAHHDPLYGSFSKLFVSTFDDARKNFAGGSIDLLHIDGMHSYEAVSHDWSSWKGKLGSRGVVLFHDTEVREREFGVWKLWDEVRAQYPHFAFTHGHGLGVLLIGQDQPDALRALAGLPRTEFELVSKFYAALGRKITLNAEILSAAGDRSRIEILMRQQTEVITALRRELESARSDVEKVKQGMSFRIGRVVTAPIRKLMGR